MTEEKRIQRYAWPNFHCSNDDQKKLKTLKSGEIPLILSLSPIFSCSSKFHFKQGENYSKPQIRSSVRSCGGDNHSKFLSFLSLPYEESDGKKHIGEAWRLARCQGELLSVHNIHLPLKTKPGNLETWCLRKSTWFAAVTGMLRPCRAKIQQITSDYFYLRVSVTA